MESQAEIVNFAQYQRKRAASVEELHFANMSELLVFLSHEIIVSRRKFSALAAASHVCPATVSKLAHGETVAPRAATVFSVLAALGFEVVVRK